MSELTRRGLLAGAGAVTAVTVAGCLGEDDDPSTGADGLDGTDATGDGDAEAETEAGGDDSAGTVLGEIVVENLDDGSHVVDVLVELDGEIEHWSTHDLEAGGEGVTIEPDWPADAGEFRLTVRLDEEEFTEVTPAQWNDPSCLAVLVLVGRDGGLRITGDTASGACERDAGGE
ncbi:hypothetical protein [Natronobeatus ordinarius]|uniref:hypothetical protein n=1 Tax=Natronobeatus ordinarius TaxID=2963433 RepID=UPI0020CF88FE|nr:hypothetical protein [Natronobeatus ordinarius]